MEKKVKKKPLCFLLVLFLLSAADRVCGLVTDHSLQLLQENINQAVAFVRPSVVSIIAQNRAEVTVEQAGLWYESIGSGFVIDERGYILTNYHVVEKARNIDVSLWGTQAKKLPAQIVHIDNELDLVVLKIDTDVPLTPVTFGNSDMLETGDWVLSVGNPFGFSHSVTLGTVSSLHRNLVIQGKSYKDMIQTDAVINEGNSGGPLVDIYGHVVGVGTAIYAPDGTYTGLGFAIPINRAKHFFTGVTGAVTAALKTPIVTPLEKSQINMNERPPNDLNHTEFSNCTTCHVITQKSVVSVNTQMTHPVAGACDKCHIMVKGKATGKAITVAAIQPFNEYGSIATSFWDYFRDNILKCIPLILVASTLFAMLGVGGGFLYVPILLACGIDFHTASTTSLLMLTVASASAVFVYYKSGYVDWKMVLGLELPTMTGAFIGGILSNHFHILLLHVMFAAMLFFASYYMLKDTRLLTHKRNLIKPGPFQWRHEFNGAVYDIDLMIAIPVTLIIGFLGGTLGIAAGWLKVPMMVVLFGIPMRIAVASSALMVPFTGLSGFLGHHAAGHFAPQLAITLAVVALIGAQIGARVSLRIDTGMLRTIFSFLLGVVGLWMILKLL
jgi:S1-C subfamily serine protease/uncharacterized membrane protein YfcA